MTAKKPPKSKPLPRELLFCILKHVQASNLSPCTLVSKEFNVVSSTFRWRNVSLQWSRDQPSMERNLKTLGMIERRHGSLVRSLQITQELSNDSDDNQQIQSRERDVGSRLLLLLQGGKLANLQTLRLYKIAFDGDLIDVLARSCPRLEHLSLAYCRTSKVEKVADLGLSCRRIRIFEIKFGDPSSEMSRELLETLLFSLFKHTRLAELRLSGWRGEIGLGNKELNTFLNSVGHSICVLSLWHVNMSPDFLRALISPMIFELELVNMDAALLEEVAAHVAEKCSGLRKLSLVPVRNVAVQLMSDDATAAVIDTSRNTLQSISLSGAFSCLDTTLSTLSGCTSIQSFSLSRDFAVTETALNALASFLFLQGSNLKELSLNIPRDQYLANVVNFEHQDAGTIGPRCELAQFICNNVSFPSLTSLELNFLFLVSTEDLAKLIRFSPRLQYVQLGDYNRKVSRQIIPWVYTCWTELIALEMDFFQGLDMSDFVTWAKVEMNKFQRIQRLTNQAVTITMPRQDPGNHETFPGSFPIRSQMGTHIIINAPVAAARQGQHSTDKANAGFEFSALRSHFKRLEWIRINGEYYSN